MGATSYICFFWVHWYNQKICKKLGINIDNSSIIMLNGHTIIRKKEIKLLKKQLIKALEKEDKLFFDNFKKETNKIFTRQKDVQYKLDKNKSLNFNLFEYFIKTSLLLYSPWFLSVVIGDFIGDYIIKSATKDGYKEKDVLKFMKVRPTLIFDEYNDSLKIKKEIKKANILFSSPNELFNEIKKHPKLYEHLQSHLKKYAWVGTHHFWGEPLNLRKYLDDLKNVVQHKEKIPRVNLSKKIKFMINVGNEFAFIRQYGAEIFNINVYKARPLLKEMAKYFNLNYDNLLYLTPNEIMNFCKKNTKPKISSISRRKKGVCILLKNKKEIVVDNQDEIKKIINIFALKNNSEKLKGIVANSGMVKGRVKIFITPKNLTKMREGDILVTPMTTPDFIPLMKKASAIVTDIGGLLSHAAIVSRELKKPCIVGTKIAAKVLKDGDLVEVDAERGIVRILK